MPFDELNTTSAHVRHGIKTGLAAILAYAIVQATGLRFGFWAVLSAVIVMQINVADSIRMCWYRFSGTAVGAIIGLFTILAFPETPLMTGIGLFCAVTFCAYMTRYNTRYRMAAITVVIVVLASVGQDERLLFSLYRVIEISIGVMCAFLVSVLIWPMRAGIALKKLLASQFQSCANVYDELIEAFLSEQTPVKPAGLLQLEKDIIEIRGLFRKVIQHERLFFDDDTRQMALQIEMLEKSLEHMHSMMQTLDEAHEQGYALYMEKEIRTLAHACEDAMRSIGTNKEPREEFLRTALVAAEEKLEELRKEGTTRRLPLRKLVQVMSFYNSIYALGDALLAGVKRHKGNNN